MVFHACLGLLTGPAVARSFDTLTITPKTFRPSSLSGESRTPQSLFPHLDISLLFLPRDRVCHQKFGCGTIRVVERNKLAVAFENAMEKKVIDTFVEKA